MINENTTKEEIKKIVDNLDYGDAEEGFRQIQSLRLFVFHKDFLEHKKGDLIYTINGINGIAVFSQIPNYFKYENLSWSHTQYYDSELYDIPAMLDNEIISELQQRNQTKSVDSYYLLDLLESMENDLLHLQNKIKLIRACLD